jgi:hypothetical protein
MINQITINGSAVVFKPGVSTSEFYNETLDSGLLVIPQNSKMTLEPMDQVIITFSGASKYYLISEVREDIVVFNSPRVYTYTISLVSPTIKLQRIVLPNRTVTQTEPPKTIGTILQQYLELYAPGLSMSTRLADLVSSAICPEDSWNRPTLFEVFNSVLASVGAVVVMPEFDYIDYLDLNATGSSIDPQYLTNGQVVQSVEDYASDIEMEAQNAASKVVNTTTVDWVVSKTTHSEMLTSDNAEIILDKPVMAIDKVLCKIIMPVYSFIAKIVDITPYVVEQSVYRLAKVTNAAGWVTGDHKRNRIYFTEGDTVIRGLSYKESTWIAGINSYAAIVNIFRNAYLSTEDLDGKLSNEYINKFVFKIDYRSLDGVKFSTERPISLQHPGTLLNNQDTAYVDLGLLAKKQQQTVNRMGNQIMTLWGKYPSRSLVPRLADTFDTDFKVMHRQLVYHATEIEAMLQLSKYNIRQNLFSGLRSKRRYTQIASAGDALLSNHLNKIRLKFSLVDESSYPSLENNMLAFGKVGKNVQLAICQTTFEDSNTSPYIGLSGSAYHVGNSVVYDVRMADNYSAGLQVEKERVFLGFRHGTNYVPYADQNGEFVAIVVDLYNRYINDKLADDNITGEPSKYDEGLEYAREQPELNPAWIDTDNRIFSSGDLYRYKDNREITAETFQFFFSSATGVFIGDAYFEDHPWLFRGTSDVSLVLKYSTTETYTEANKNTPKGTTHADLSVFRSGNRVGYVLAPGSAFDDTITCWCICNAAGRVYLAVNSNNNVVYLNKED